MRWVVTNVAVEVHEATPREHDWLRHVLTIKVEKGRKPHLETLYEDTRRPPRFPIGWYRSLVKKTKEVGLEVAVHDSRVAPCGADWSQNIAWLRFDQLMAVRAITLHGQGIIDIPTGGGKTIVAMGAVKVLPCRWGFFVEDLALLSQTLTQYHRWHGKLAGMIGDGRWSVGDFTVASMQTLFAAYNDTTGRFAPHVEEFLRSRQGIIVDEVHGVAARRNATVVDACVNAFYRIGLSGTPIGRGDKRDAKTIGHIGPIIYQIGSKELETDKQIARATVYMVRLDQPNTPPYRRGGYAKAIKFSKRRNGVIVELWRRRKKPNLTYIRELDHGEYLMQLAKWAGLRAEFVTGPDDETTRKRKVAMLEGGDLDVLIASNAFRQGVDLIHVRTVALALGGKEFIGTNQRKGRGGRICRTPNCRVCAVEGLKDEVTIFDFWDTDSAYTQAHDGEVHWLERHSDARKKAFELKGCQVQIV